MIIKKVIIDLLPIGCRLTPIRSEPKFITFKKDENILFTPYGTQPPGTKRTQIPTLSSLKTIFFVELLYIFIHSYIYLHSENCYNINL